MEHNYIIPSLFPDYEPSSKPGFTNNKEKQRWQFNKTKNFGLEYCSDATFQGKYGIVLIKKYTDTLPDKFITLGEINNIGSKTTGVVSFTYDYELDRLASSPFNYAKKLAKYKCTCEPDFSMKIGDPLAVVVGNTFKSHSTAFYLQEHGCQVIPTMKWSSPDSYEVCFDGYEKGGAVIVSTIGVLKDERSHMYFKSGFTEMLKRISPEAVVLYGDYSEWIKELMPSQLDVHHFCHERFNRMRGYGK